MENFWAFKQTLETSQIQSPSKANTKANRAKKRYNIKNIKFSQNSGPQTKKIYFRLFKRNKASIAMS
jgi:hypothetical protein